MRRAVIGLALLGLGLSAAPDTGPTLHLADYAAMPITGSGSGKLNDAYLARVNFLREEPQGARFFVNDLIGPLYILDRKTKKLTTYLDFDGSGTKRGLFDKLTTEPGLASGFISFQFDPDYARNGRFYTIHLEDPQLPGSLVPDSSTVPGLKTAGYTPTPPITTPGTIEREAVLIEWTDTNPFDVTFEGSARELMRLQYNSRIHPMGDLIFNPTAKRGDPDWRMLYVSCGDGGSGEQRTDIRHHPQRLDTLVGKILRIVPDLAEHTNTSTVSDNGRYRIPRDNPFVATAGARKEVWAYGLRNPHRLIWDVDPDRPADNHLITTVIGLRTWETVNIIHKGVNYGYSEREGPQALRPDNTLVAPPQPDKIPVRVTDTLAAGETTPTYPVLQYSHQPGGGDAIAGGFVYRGRAVPSLRGKYIFGDMTTGRVWYADYKEMLAADDGDARTVAQAHELGISLKGGTSDGRQPDSTVPAKPPLSLIVQAAYHARGGTDPDLPGRDSMWGPGRVDIRFAVDAAGELYILSKSDGMIRAVVAADGIPQR
jgi:hypothetical protein